MLSSRDERQEILSLIKFFMLFLPQCILVRLGKNPNVVIWPKYCESNEYTYQTVSFFKNNKIFMAKSIYSEKKDADATLTLPGESCAAARRPVAKCIRKAPCLNSLEVPRRKKTSRRRGKKKKMKKKTMTRKTRRLMGWEGGGGGAGDPQRWKMGWDGVLFLLRVLFSIIIFYHSTSFHYSIRWMKG